MPALSTACIAKCDLSTLYTARLTRPPQPQATNCLHAAHLISFSQAMIAASEGRLGSAAAVLSCTAPGAAAAAAAAASSPPPAGAAASCRCCASRASSSEACIARAMLLSQSSGSCVGRARWWGPVKGEEWHYGGQANKRMT